MILALRLALASQRAIERCARHFDRQLTEPCFSHLRVFLLFPLLFRKELQNPHILP